MLKSSVPFNKKIDKLTNIVVEYLYIKERGYAIYPGKVTDADTFRIGNIGEIYLEDIDRVCDIFEEFFKAKM